MKIIFLTRLFYPHIGGVEKHVLTLSKTLQKSGHNVLIITEKYDLTLKGIDIVQGIKIYRIPVPKNEKNKKFVIWKWIIKHRSLIMDSDIVHAHDVFYWMLPIKFLNPKKKLFTTFHGYEGNEIPGINKKLMHVLAWRLSNKTLSIGKFYTKWYGTKSKVVSFGAVSNNIKESSPSQASIISFVGRLEDETGIDEYVDSIKILMNKVKVSLNVYGDGTKRRELEKKINKYKLPVSLHGWVKIPEKKIQISKIVFTSRYLGILEALSQGKFVVAHYNNEIKKDYLQMSPFANYISIVSTPKEISDSVESYLTHPKLNEEKIKKGKVWAKNQTWKKLANQYLKLWN